MKLKRKTPSHISLVCLLASAPLVFAQSVSPFTAKTRTVTYQIAPNGAKTVIGIRVGTFSRDSKGETLAKYHTLNNGTAGADQGVLTDPDGKVSRLDWARQEAVVVQDSRGSSYVRPFSDVKGEAHTINGVSCVVIPVQTRICNGRDCTPQPADPGDFDCVSPQYGVVVHLDLIQHIGTRTTEMVKDSYDFAPQDPDPASMKIPAGFARRRNLVTSPLAKHY